MTTEVVRRLSPEGEELAARREELARLEAELADRELALASLRAELAAFEGLYLRRVGVLYAELDEWNARLAELRAERSRTPEAQTEAGEARSQAQESYSAAHGEAADVQPFSPTPELKRLYREAAKRVHPDTAANEGDRVRRERLMKEVNAAYAAGDEDALRRVLADPEDSPDAIQGSGVGADLVRVLRQLRRVRDRISAIQVEIVSLSETDLAKLKAKADFAATEERNLLEEMVAFLRSRLNSIREQFDAACSEGTKA
jgi:chromosome segregation ATPase